MRKIEELQSEKKEMFPRQRVKQKISDHESQLHAHGITRKQRAMEKKHREQLIVSTSLRNRGESQAPFRHQQFAQWHRHSPAQCNKRTHKRNEARAANTQTAIAEDANAQAQRTAKRKRHIQIQTHERKAMKKQMHEGRPIDEDHIPGGKH